MFWHFSGCRDDRMDVNAYVAKSAKLSMVSVPIEHAVNHVVESIFQKKNRLTADGKYGEKTHAALMAVVGETETTEEEDTNEKPVTKSVVLHATDDKVNIRFGNGDEYGLMTTVADGTEVPYVATADNAWMAVAVNGMVGWVKTE